MGSTISFIFGMLVAPIILPSIVIPVPMAARSVRKVKEMGLSRLGNVSVRLLSVGKQKLSTIELCPMGYWEDASNPKQVIIVLFGNAGRIDGQLAVLKSLASTLNVCVVGFDYRFVGDSGGWWASGVGDLVSDTRDQIERIAEERGLDLNQILLYGQSLGGAVAVHTVAKYAKAARARQSKDAFRDVPRVFADRTFGSIVDLAPYFITLFATQVLGRGYVRELFVEWLSWALPMCIPSRWNLDPAKKIRHIDQNHIAVLNYQGDSMIPAPYSLYEYLKDEQKDEVGFLGVKSSFHRSNSFQGGFTMHELPVFMLEDEAMESASGDSAREFMLGFIHNS